MGLFNRNANKHLKIEDVIYKIENDVVDLLSKHQLIKYRIQAEKISSQIKNGKSKIDQEKIQTLNKVIMDIIEHLKISSGQSAGEDLEYLQDITDGMIVGIELSSVKAQYEGNRNIDKILTSKSKDTSTISRLIEKQTQKKAEYELMLKDLKNDVVKAQSKLKKNPIELNNLWRTIQRIENNKNNCDIQIGKLQEALNATEGRYNILEDYELTKVAASTTEYDSNELERIKGESESIKDKMTESNEHIGAIEGINDPNKIMSSTADVSNELDLWLAQQSEDEIEEVVEESKEDKKNPIDIKQ